MKPILLELLIIRSRLIFQRGSLFNFQLAFLSSFFQLINHYFIFQLIFLSSHFLRLAIFHFIGIKQFHHFISVNFIISQLISSLFLIIFFILFQASQVPFILFLLIFFPSKFVFTLFLFTFAPIL